MQEGITILHLLALLPFVFVILILMGSGKGDCTKKSIIPRNTNKRKSIIPKKIN